MWNERQINKEVHLAITRRDIQNENFAKATTRKAHSCFDSDSGFMSLIYFSYLDNYKNVHHLTPRGHTTYFEINLGV